MKAKVIGFISFLLIFIMAFSFYAFGEGNSPAPSPLYVADGFALFDVDEEKFLIDHNIDKIISPASSVKIMSGLIVCEKLALRTEETVTITNDMINDSSGKSMGLSVGKQIRIKDLMYAAYGCGYNDAAVALAVISVGSTDKMIQLMNARAKELSMYSTNYTNVTGLEDINMKTTVRDLVNLALSASQNDLFLDVSSAYNYIVKYANGEEQTVYGSNEILNKNSIYFCSSAKGMNSGATESGACLITYGEAKGRRLIAVATGCSDENDLRFALVQDSLDWGYKSAYITVASQNELVGNAKVNLGQTDNMTVDLVLAEDVVVSLTSSENEELLHYTLIKSNETLTAPIKKGDIVAKYVVWYGNEIKGVANVTVSESVEKSGFLSFVDGIKHYLKGRAFIATVISVTLGALLVVIYPKVALSRRQKKRKYVKKRSGFDLRK